MGHRYAYKQLMLYILIFCVATSFLLLTNHFFCIRNYHYYIDPLLSCNQQSSIKAFLHQTLGKQFSSDLASNIEQQFRYIQHCLFLYMADGTLHCSIKAAAPLLCLNKDYLLLANDAIVPAHMYDPCAIQQLATIEYANDNMLAIPYHQVCQFKKIPVHVFQHYHVRYHRPTNIELIDKEQKKFIILADTTALEQFDHAVCTKIKKELQHQHAFKKNSWIADIRFKNQIILRQQRPGGDL